MYVKELKAQVQHDAYVVDTHLVAEALLRAAVAHRLRDPTVRRPDARDPAAVALRQPRFRS